MPLIQQINQRRNLLAHEGLHGPWLVIFDIDSTLMNTAPRNMAILKQAAGYFPALKTYLDDIREEELGWNIRTPLIMAGLKDSSLLEEVFQFWKDRFFTDPYLLNDRPYPGAAEILNRLTAEDYTLVYLTGRHVGGMDKGTRESFINWGFPVDEPIQFFFKPSFDMEDHSFKREACTDLRNRGTVTAFFENEPANANLLKQEFPNALGFFLDTITSPEPEPLHPGFIRLTGFI
jgi:hypothetical protein